MAGFQNNNRTESSGSEYDFGALLRRLDNDSDALKEVLEIFVMDAGQRIARIRNALVCRDRATMAAELHTLKGSAATVAASNLRNAAAHLEKTLAQQDEKQLENSVEILETCYLCLVEAIRNILNKST